MNKKQLDIFINLAQRINCSKSDLNEIIIWNIDLFITVKYYIHLLRYKYTSLQVN